MRHPDCADNRADCGDADRGVHRLARTDALHHGIRAVFVGELADVFDNLVPTLGDDVGGPEIFRLPAGMELRPDMGEVARLADQTIAIQSPN